MTTPTRFAVRKVSGKYDYPVKWGVVEISHTGSVRRVRHFVDKDRDVVQQWADELTKDSA